MDSGDGLGATTSAWAAGGTGRAKVDARLTWDAVPGAPRDGEVNRVAKRKASARKRGVRLLLNRCIEIVLGKGSCVSPP